MKMLIYTAIAIILCNEVLSQNVQWRGPDRSGIFPEVGLLSEWPEGGPELALKVDGIGSTLLTGKAIRKPTSSDLQVRGEAAAAAVGLNIAAEIIINGVLR